MVEFNGCDGYTISISFMPAISILFFYQGFDKIHFLFGKFANMRFLISYGFEFPWCCCISIVVSRWGCIKHHMCIGIGFCFHVVVLIRSTVWFLFYYHQSWQKSICYLKIFQLDCQHYILIFLIFYLNSNDGFTLDWLSACSKKLLDPDEVGIVFPADQEHGMTPEDAKIIKIHMSACGYIVS